MVGGLTSPGGAVFGGFSVGVIENLAGTFIPVVGREMKLTIALMHHRRGAVREAERPVRPAGRDAGVTMHAPATEQAREPPVGDDRRHPAADLAAGHARRRAGDRSPLIPFVAKNFYIFQITLAIIYAIAILGLNLLTGFNGQFSLGHSAFYAIGAYTAAIMMENIGAQLCLDDAGGRRSSASCSASCSACRRCGWKASIWRSRPSRSRSRCRRC